MPVVLLHRRAKQRGLSTLGYTLFLLVSVLLSLEVLLRVFDPIGIVYLYDVNRYFKGMLVPDERFAYIHRPNSTGVLNGEEFRFNSIGLRGREIANQPADGRRRLLVLGDSVVLGWGVAEQDMFSNRLQRLFDASQLPVEVVAAGAGSWNTRTEYEFLRHVGVELQPDALLLLIVPNDLDPKRDGGYTEVSREELFPPKDDADRSRLANAAEDFWRFAARRSYVAAYLKYLWQEYLDTGSGTPLNQDSPQWRDAQLALDGIIDLTRKRDIDLFVYLDGPAAMVATNPVLKLYDRHLKSRGIRGLPVPDDLFGAPGLHNSMVDSHLNGEGNRILAEAMFPQLKPHFEPGPAQSESAGSP